MPPRCDDSTGCTTDVTPVSRRRLDRSRAENQGWSGWTSTEVHRVVSYSTSAKLRPLYRMTGSSSSTKASALMRDWIHVTPRGSNDSSSGGPDERHCRHRSATVVLVMVAPSNRRAASFYSVARQWLWEKRHGWKRKHRLMPSATNRRECRARCVGSVDGEPNIGNRTHGEHQSSRSSRHRI